MKNIGRTITITALALGLTAAPVFCGETETEEGILNRVTTEMTDGTMTIRIESAKEEDPGFYWESWHGDKGDASCVECITETDMEDGLAYAGSFRAIDDGEDTIRLVYTNGHYTREYLDFNVTSKDGKITESTGGGQAFETKGEDLAPYLEGIWEESDGGTHYLEIALVDDGGLSFRVSDSSGRNGNTVFYTMTAYYDAILEELVYWDGTEHSAVITGEETETEESNTGEGTGMFGIVVLSDEETDDAAIGIHWLDNTFGNDGTNMFVKSE